jgi:hypothetical protein
MLCSSLGVSKADMSGFIRIFWLQSFCDLTIFQLMEKFAFVRPIKVFTHMVSKNYKTCYTQFLLHLPTNFLHHPSQVTKLKQVSHLGVVTLVCSGARFNNCPQRILNTQI